MREHNASLPVRHGQLAAAGPAVSARDREGAADAEPIRTANALTVLLVYGEAGYDLGLTACGVWRATCRDGTGIVTAASAAGLHRALTELAGSRPLLSRPPASLRPGSPQPGQRGLPAGRGPSDDRDRRDDRTGQGPRRSYGHEPQAGKEIG
jgi:hypothetical protein